MIIFDSWQSKEDNNLKIAGIYVKESERISEKIRQAQEREGKLRDEEENKVNVINWMTPLLRPIFPFHIVQSLCVGPLLTRCFINLQEQNQSYIEQGM
jgi:hypothetical protein